MAAPADVCDPAIGFGEYLADFQFIKAMTCTYANAAGFLVTGLLVYGGISLGIYIRTGSVLIPFVLVLTTGGAVLAQIASVGVTIATIILLTVGAGVMTYVYLAFSR